MFGAHAHRDDVIRGAEEDREIAKGENAKQTAKNIRLRVAARTFTACQPLLSLFSRFRPFALRDPSFRKHSTMFKLKENTSGGFQRPPGMVPQNKTCFGSAQR